MPTSHWLVRPAGEADARELARLTTQLGYPWSEASIRERLVYLLGRPDDRVLVAEAPGGSLAGWVHGFLSQLLESDFRVEIGGLVVDERWRRTGIGRQLVAAIGDWARERGAAELSVRCREDRTDAHRFYQSLTFQHTKSQRVFRQRLRKVD